ncbi:hypothetical protein ES708_02753 [subsurface metagenome]
MGMVRTFSKMFCPIFHNCNNGSLLRIRNCISCLFCCLSGSLGKSFCAKTYFTLGCFCQALKKLGQNSSGVTACSGQSRIGNNTTNFGKRRFFTFFNLFYNAVHSSCHISTCVPISYRENIDIIQILFHLIYPLG